jgi:hypothetical protein
MGVDEVSFGKASRSAFTVSPACVQLICAPPIGARPTRRQVRQRSHRVIQPVTTRAQGAHRWLGHAANVWRRGAQFELAPWRSQPALDQASSLSLTMGFDHHLGLSAEIHPRIGFLYLRKIGHLRMSVDSLPMSGVKGSRVQISPARRHDDGLARLIRANSSGDWSILDKPECSGVRGRLGPPARVRRSDVEDGLVIRVEIAARHRRVLMATHTLEKVQLDAGVGHPARRSDAHWQCS